MTAPLASASCANHPQAGAVEICSRCGAFLCGECVLYVREVVPVCAGCQPLVALEGPPSRAAWAAPLLGGAGLGLVLAGFFVRGRPGLALWGGALPLGIAGLVLAVRELRRIARKQAPRRGAWLARTGLALGLLFALLSLGLLAGFALFVSRMLGVG